MEGEKWNFDIKLTSHVLSWLKLIKIAPNSDFESQFLNPFSVNEELQNNELEPDVNYYLDEISSLDTKYYVPDEVKDQLKSLQLNSFTVFHLNIRSMKKHFEAFQDFTELWTSNLVQSAFQKTGFNLTKFQIQIFSCQDIIVFT